MEPLYLEGVCQVSRAGSEISAPVLLEDRPTAQSKGGRSGISGALLDVALLGRNWFASSRHDAASEHSGDAEKLLLEADHFAWLGNWTAAGPLYVHAEGLLRMDNCRQRGLLPGRRLLGYLPPQARWAMMRDS